MLAALAAMLALAARSGSADDGRPVVHVVSVGDSLAVGVQPGLDGTGRATGQGYPRQFARLLEARGIEVEEHELGCGGATSASVLDGGRDCAPSGDEPYDNDDPLTSQATYAEGLLSRLSGEPTIALVDVGGNDLGGCLRAGTPDAGCVKRIGDDLRDRLATLLGRLRAASPNAIVAVLELYDPVLGVWDRVPHRRAEIAAFHGAFRDHVNRAISSVAAREGVRVGRLGHAMAQDRPVDAAAGRRPAGVAAVCDLTWMCVKPPLRPDIHLRREGYAAAAQALLRAVDPDLSTLVTAP